MRTPVTDSDGSRYPDTGQSPRELLLESFLGQACELMGEIRAFPNLLLPYLDGGNLNASSIDIEAEDEIVIEAEPARPKRKLIATLQVITGVTDWASFNPGPLSMSSSPSCSGG